MVAVILAISSEYHMPGADAIGPAVSLDGYPRYKPQWGVGLPEQKKYVPPLATPRVVQLGAPGLLGMALELRQKTPRQTLQVCESYFCKIFFLQIWSNASEAAPKRLLLT